MSALDMTAMAIRRVGRAGHGFLAAGATAALVAAGFFHGAFDSPGFLHVVAAAAWATSLTLRVRERIGVEAPRRTTSRDLEIGLLAVTGAYALVDAAGDLGTPLYPLVFVIVAFLASFAARPAWIASAATAVGLESWLWYRGDGFEQPGLFVCHVVFIGAFAALYLAFVRTEIRRLRARARAKLEREICRVREAARDYRLLSAPTGGMPGHGPAAEEERLVASSLAEIKQAIHGTLDLLVRTMGLQTAVVLWLDASGDTLKIAELASERDDVLEGPFPAGEGVVAGAVRYGRTVNLESIRPTYRGIPYYLEPCPARSLLVVPIKDGDSIRGALCLDRSETRVFTPSEEEAALAAARTIARAVQNERVFAQIERSKAEHVKLYRASEALGGSLSEEEVVEAVLRAAREIAEHDCAAVTFYDRAARRHLVRRASGLVPEGIEGLSFCDNAGLVSSAVKVRHYLPYRGDFDAAQQVLFTRRARVEGMLSMLVMPLVARDEPLGAVILGAKRANAFPEAARTTLQVLTNQMAVALANARMYKRLEELATTDGLTGLSNHRVFQQELEKKIRSAERFGKKLSLILTDVDFFKKVNDDHGHPIGDDVLRGFAGLLGRTQRGTDLVARYGGEEFAVICEETDATGAKQLAERIRSELQQTAFQTAKGAIRVTCSLGIATFPEDGRTKADLVSRADQALYHAKRSGRNRTVSARELPQAA